MNRIAKIVLIVAVCLIPLGIMVAVFGVFLGGKMSWRYEFGKGVSTSSSEMVSDIVDLKEFDTLEIDVSSVDVSIVEGDSYRLEYRTEKEKEPVITEKGGKLTVTQPSTGISFFNFEINPEDDTYTIMVPQGSKVINVKAEVSSGEITIDRVNMSGRIEASSGDILINDIEGEKLEVKTSSGKIACDKVRASETYFEASSGDIELLRINNDKLTCETSSGDIAINDSEAESVDCNASSGEVSMELNGNADDYSYDIDASSGDIKVNGQETEDRFVKEAAGNGKIKIKTSSGDIEVSIK